MTIYPSKKLEWVRVSKANPCPVCKKEDWCTVAPEAQIAHCMRVTSPQPSKNEMGGHIHRLGGELPKYDPPVRPARKQVEIDAEKIWKPWFDATTAAQFIQLGTELGVEPMALHSLGAAWASPFNAWAFPMCDGGRKMVGIRLRNSSGFKWAVEGSHAGLFIPRHEMKNTLYILEGPTDTAAALSLELSAIGRPACMGCEDKINELIWNRHFMRAVIIADNDHKTRPNGTYWNPGNEGAEKLQATMKIPSCIWLAPFKDIREFIQDGGTAAIVESLVKDLLWVMPKAK